MPIHEIEMSIPKKMVMNADVVFEVFSDEEKLGDLRVSRGTIDWHPARARSTIQLTWEQFDTVMRTR